MSAKQAACLVCRKSKIKCRRDEGVEACERCKLLESECIIPEFHIGRQKGVKNKRSGLEKAIYQVEEAIKKRKPDTETSRATLEHLKSLLEKPENDLDDLDHQDTEPSPVDAIPAIEGDVTGASSDDQLALEDVENPLQLLARASDLRILSPQGGDHGASTPGSRNNPSEQSAYLDVHQFFLPMKANLDQGHRLDPIDVGLVTMEEAEMLLEYFHRKLAHTRWGLDPVVHTLPFIRNRSSFLFTTLLAMTAIFIPETASLAKRLLLHRRYLAEQVIIKKYKSVEIVLAFMVSIPWMPPGAHASDDDTSMYLATAQSIALDLSLDKVITPSKTIGKDLRMQTPKSDCFSARKALTMDGFEDIEVESEWGQRLLRRRERAWIALFVLERGVCLARGRSNCVPKTSLIQLCDKWHCHPHNIPQDGPLISVAVLRRDLDDLFTNVRTRCDTYRTVDAGLRIAQEIEAAIESFFKDWSQTWTSVIQDPERKTLPPYVEILLTHQRLSTYSMLLNHPSAPSEVKRSFRASTLSSALNVMRAAIQGETRLKSMPNNTVTMICFAASIALALSAPIANKQSSKNLAPSIHNLIQETATVLERIGSTPTHRNGSSVVYGRFLRVLVEQAPGMGPVPRLEPRTFSSSITPSGSQATFVPLQPLAPLPQTHDLMSNLWMDPLPFSTMSYNEVNETVTNFDMFSTAILDMPWDDSNPLMTTDWINLPDFNFPS